MLYNDIKSCGRSLMANTAIEPSNKRSVEDISEQATKRRLIISQYLLEGTRTHVKIADRLKEEHGIVVSPKTISFDVAKLHDDYKLRIAGNIDTERAIDLERIETAIGAVWETILDGKNDKILMVFVKLLERKAKMLGYDEPARIDIRTLVMNYAASRGHDPEIYYESVKDLIEVSGAGK